VPLANAQDSEAGAFGWAVNEAHLRLMLQSYGLSSVSGSTAAGAWRKYMGVLVSGPFFLRSRFARLSSARCLFSCSR